MKLHQIIAALSRSYPASALVAGIVALLSPMVEPHAIAQGVGVSIPFRVDTSELRVDTDQDGMPDNYEIAVGLNPFIQDANADPDGDGSTNIEEYNAGTSPFASDRRQFSQAISAVFVFNARILILDTDGDGMPDDWESAHGLNPFLNDATQDSDGDGVANYDEYNAGTAPLLIDAPAIAISTSPAFGANTALYPFPVTTDTDGDGMPDWWELRYGFNPLAIDAAGDSDGDGLSNLMEFLDGRNPLSNESVTEVMVVSGGFSLATVQLRIDTDGDGIPDAWEIAHGLDPLRIDLNEDPDQDGRNNIEEYNAGTDPQVNEGRGPSIMLSPIFLANTDGFPAPLTRDTDGDGIPDWWEIQYGLNHTTDDSEGDLDSDGITNLEEYNSGTNPILADYPPAFATSNVFLVDTGGQSFDTDGDGLPDWWEKLYFNDPRAASPVADTDGDGHSNAAEFFTGSNPLDPNSVLRITGVQSMLMTNETQVIIRWMSFQGSTYSILAAPIVQGPYSPVAAGLVSTPPLNTFIGASIGTNKFFRIGSAQ